MSLFWMPVKEQLIDQDTIGMSKALRRTFGSEVGKNRIRLDFQHIPILVGMAAERNVEDRKNPYIDLIRAIEAHGTIEVSWDE